MEEVREMPKREEKNSEINDKEQYYVTAAWAIEKSFLSSIYFFPIPLLAILYTHYSGELLGLSLKNVILVGIWYYFNLGLFSTINYKRAKKFAKKLEKKNNILRQREEDDNIKNLKEKIKSLFSKKRLKKNLIGVTDE